MDIVLFGYIQKLSEIKALLKSSLDTHVNRIYPLTLSVKNYPKLKKIFKSSLDTHGYWIHTLSLSVKTYPKLKQFLSCSLILLFIGTPCSLSVYVNVIKLELNQHA